MENSSTNIIFFDGVCNLCNSTVDFIITRDTNQMIQYAPLQGVNARKYIGDKLVQNLNTVTFYQDGKIYTKSEAIIRVLSLLGPKYALLSIFLLLPTFIRDFFYDLVAKNRYRFWGKRDTCRLPSPAEKKLFLD